MTETPAPEPTSDVAARVHETLLNNFGFTSMTDGLTSDMVAPEDRGNLLYFITNIEDLNNPGDIIVTVQERDDQISEDEANLLALRVLNLTGLEITDLKYVAVQGAEGMGIISSETRANAPLLNR